MAVTVKLPTQLRDAAGGAGRGAGRRRDGRRGARGALRRSTASCASGSSDDDGGLRRFVNVYLDGEDIRFLDGLDTAGRRRRRGDDPAGGRRRLGRARQPPRRGAKSSAPTRSSASAGPRHGGERLHALGRPSSRRRRRSPRARRSGSGRAPPCRPCEKRPCSQVMHSGQRRSTSTSSSTVGFAAQRLQEMRPAARARGQRATAANVPAVPDGTALSAARVIVIVISSWSVQTIL